jgi:UDP-N-acetylglucosamine 2-epimerase (non-hydrolysing)
MLNIDFVLGTRPEITKCAALIFALTEYADVSLEIAITGQQTAIVETSLVDLGIQNTCRVHWLSRSRDDNYIPDWQAQATEALIARWKQYPKNAAVVQGDTSSACLGAVIAAQCGLIVCHLEAGIRHEGGPVEPEEINRRVISRASSLHFAPSDAEKASLVGEGTKPEDIVVIGDLNPGAIALTDSLLPPKSLAATSVGGTIESINSESQLPGGLRKGYVLCTFHRPASLDNHRELARQLRELATTVTPLRIVLCQKPDSRWIPFFESFQTVGNVIPLEFQPPTAYSISPS